MGGSVWGFKRQTNLIRLIVRSWRTSAPKRRSRCSSSRLERISSGMLGRKYMMFICAALGHSESLSLCCINVRQRLIMVLSGRADLVMVL